MAIGDIIVLVGAIAQTFVKTSGGYIGTRFIIGMGGVISAVAAPALAIELAHPRQVSLGFNSKSTTSGLEPKLRPLTAPPGSSAALRLSVSHGHFRSAEPQLTGSADNCCFYAGAILAVRFPSFVHFGSTTANS